MRINFRLYHEALLRLIYPVSCGVCNAALELQEKNLCAGCLRDLRGQRYSHSELLTEHSFDFVDNAWSLYPYESPAREILAGVKFFRQRALLEVFREDIAFFASSVLPEFSYDYAVPVPIDRGRLSERHFNQSEILAQMAAKNSFVPIKKILRKNYGTIAQSRLNQKERRANLYGIFSLVPQASVTGKKILLIDDILTTGATADEAARVLKKAGAKTVDLFTVSRTAQNSRHFPNSTSSSARNEAFFL